jgi:hypothetical protein
MVAQAASGTAAVTGKRVRDGGVDQAWWSKPMSLAQGGTTSSLWRGGAGRHPQRFAMGTDEQGSSDSDCGTLVTVTTNFSNLVA